MANSARIAIVPVGFAVLLVVLQEGRVILAPVTPAIIIGLMFGPVADRLEAFGVPSALSAGVVVLLLLAVIFGGVALFAVPLSEWVARAPAIWEKLQNEISALRRTDGVGGRVPRAIDLAIRQRLGHGGDSGGWRAGDWLGHAGAGHRGAGADLSRQPLFFHGHARPYPRLGAIALCQPADALAHGACVS
ncbi:hypothetical protein N8D56_12315 [Devosia sp. A8/3-2]|nr:hypothetical protein N8D56_12315 [Devosia sp. A8/3-2]